MPVRDVRQLKPVESCRAVDPGVHIPQFENGPHSRIAQQEGAVTSE